MNVSKRIAFTVLSLAGVLAAGAAQARPNVDVSVHIGSPGFVLGLPLPPLPHVVITPSRGHGPVYGHAPVRGHGHGHVGYGDRDRDGVPNRYDRVYNPRWDRDGDGVPNRYDRVHNPRWDRDGDGVPNRYDRHPNHPRGYHDRDRDGVPNWRDNRDNRGGRGHGDRDGRWRGGRGD